MKLIKDGQTAEDSCQVEIAPGTVAKIFDIAPADAAASFLFLNLTDDEGKEITTNEYFLPAEDDVYDWGKTSWVHTPIRQYASYAMLDSMCTRTCELLVTHRAENLYETTVSNPSDKVAFIICLKAKNQQGQLICPAYWSDNYFSLAPGESRTVTCQLPSLNKGTTVHISYK